MFRKFRKKIYNRITNERDINYLELKERVKTGAILIDVRSIQEYQEGHLEGAIILPEYIIEKSIENVTKDKNQEIILYCSSGNRSKKAYKKLQAKGYNNLYNLKGGLQNI